MNIVWCWTPTVVGPATLVAMESPLLRWAPRAARAHVAVSVAEPPSGGVPPAGDYDVPCGNEGPRAAGEHGRQRRAGDRCPLGGARRVSRGPARGGPRGDVSRERQRRRPRAVAGPATPAARVVAWECAGAGP